MIELLLVIFSTAMVLWTSDLPPFVSDNSALTLIIEHLLLILFSKVLIDKQFRGQQVKSRRTYFLFFLIGYSISLIFTNFFWIPDMIKNYSTGWDTFDPIKYYAIANEMVSGGEGRSSVFFPVVFIYYVEMLVLGVHPLVPFFVNQFLYLYAVIILAKYVNCDSNYHLRKFAWLLLIPEALYFNVTSSKDILCLICATIIFVHTQKILSKNYTTSNYIIAAIAFVAMFIARTGMALMAALSVAVFFLNFKKLGIKQVAFLLAGGLVFVFAVHFSDSLGVATTASELSEKAEGQMSGDMSYATELADQTSSAFANKLVPHNSVEFVVFGVIRSIVYAMLSPTDLHIFFEPQNFTLIYTEFYTSLLMTISWVEFFYIFVNRKRCLKGNLKKLAIVVVLYVLSVGMFNPMMIHRRYRLVYSLLFLALSLKSWLLIRDSRRKRLKINSVQS